MLQMLASAETSPGVQVSARAAGDLVIDMSNMQGVVVDPVSLTLTAQGKP